MAIFQADIDSGVKTKGFAQTNSGVLGLTIASADSAIRGIIEDLNLGILSGIKGIAEKEIDVDSGIEGSGFTEVSSGLLGKEYLGVSSAIMGGDPNLGIRATFSRKTIDSVSAVSSQEDLITVLRVLFDYDYGQGTFRRAVQLEAGESIKRYGRIEKEIQAYWLSSFRAAVQMGEKQLKYYSRPKWDVSFISNLDYADISSGEWVVLEEHPLLPISGRVLVINAPLDLSVGEASFTVEKVVGNLVAIEVTKLSEAFEPEVLEGLTITYKDGVATITILNELGESLGGASVMLDGETVRTTDSLGRVQFTTTRGKHRLLVEATGYAPLEFEIEV